MTTPVPAAAAGRRPTRSSQRMKNRLSCLHRFGRDTRGATAIEYALISGLIFLAIVGALNFYAERMKIMYGKIETAVTKN